MKTRAQMAAWSRRVPAVPREEERRKGETWLLTILPIQNPENAMDTEKPITRLMRSHTAYIYIHVLYIAHNHESDVSHVYTA